MDLTNIILKVVGGIFVYAVSVVLSVIMGRAVDWSGNGTNLGVLALIPVLNVIVLAIAIVTCVVPKLTMVIENKEL